MNGLILTSLGLPLLGFILIFFIQHKREKKLPLLAFGASHAMGFSIIALLVLWALGGYQNHEYQWLTLYETDDYSFPLLFYLDRVGAAFLFCTWAIFSIIVKYCRVYLHREAGYKRFFFNYL